MASKGSVTARKGQVAESSGNVFSDMGFERPDEEQMKPDLVRAIRQIVRRRRLTQVQAAKILGVNQPKVSALMRGHLAGFSTDWTAMWRSLSNPNRRLPGGRPGSRCARPKDSASVSLTCSPPQAPGGGAASRTSIRR